MAENDPKNSPRYPYTYAADLVRYAGGYEGVGLKLSRSDASQIRQLFAKVLGMDDALLAQKLADYHLEHEEEVTTPSVDEVIRRINAMVGS